MGEYTSTLKKLEKERQRLTSQLADVNTAIETLLRISGEEFSESSPLSSAKSSKTLPYEDYEMVIPEKYVEDLTLQEKLLFALKRNMGAFAHEAAEFIFEIDEAENLNYLKKRFTDIASAMARANKLTYKKIGKKYKYYIPEKLKG